MICKYLKTQTNECTLRSGKKNTNKKLPKCVYSKNTERCPHLKYNQLMKNS